MEIAINAQPHTTHATTLAELIAEQGLDTRGVAFALNGQVIRREAWAETPLSAGAQVLLIRATQGG